MPPFARRRRRAPWMETLNGVLRGLSARGDNRGCFGWPRVQLICGLVRTIETADLSASGPTSIPQVSSMVGRPTGGQLILAWWADGAHTVMAGSPYPYHDFR